MDMETRVPTPAPSLPISPANGTVRNNLGESVAKSVSRHDRSSHEAQQLRILIVLEAAGGGVGRHVTDLANGLLARGHAVHLIYAPDRAEKGFVEAVAATPGLTTHPLAMHRAVGLEDLKAMRALRELIKQTGPFDLAHAHSSKAGALLRLALRGTPTPVIYTPHAYVTLDPKLGLPKRIIYGTAERLLAPMTSQTICVSEHERRHAVAQGIPDTRISVIHNGIVPLPPVDRSTVRAELGLSESTVCIGTVGRLSQQKATDKLITAFSMMQAREIDTRLVVVGDGPQRQTLQTLVAQLGLGQRVTLTGAADGQRLMAGFDLFALSSNYEAFPYVLVEAAARGLPIVMTETGGAESIVRNGRNGFVVPQGNLEAFAAHLRTLSRKPPLRETMGRYSKMLSREFSAERMIDSTVAVYQRIRTEAGGKPTD